MMNDFVQRGKIRYFGASNWTAARLEAANTFASSHGMQGFCADQLMYSLATVNPHEIGDQTLVAMNTASREYHEKTALPRYQCYEQMLQEFKGYFYRMAVKTGTLWENDTERASCNHGFASHVAYWLLQLREHSDLVL